MYPLTLPFPTFVKVFTLTENLIAFWSISDIKLSPVQFKTSVLHLVQRFSPACYMTCNSRKDSVCCLFTLWALIVLFFLLSSSEIQFREGGYTEEKGSKIFLVYDICISKY